MKKDTKDIYAGTKFKWNATEGFWQVTIPVCPYCGEKHLHGGGGDRKGPELGYRSPHCMERHPLISRDYLLKEIK